MSRRSVPVGVQFVTAVGGFASGLLALGGVLMLYLAVQDGDLAFAAQVLPLVGLAVANLVSLYGLVSLERWGYRWARRLFLVAFLLNLPRLRLGTQDPIGLGTVLFLGGTLTYLWLLDDTAVYGHPTGTGAEPSTAPTAPSDEPVEVDPLDDGETEIDVDPLSEGHDDHDHDHDHGGDGVDSGTGTGADDGDGDGDDGDED